MRNIWLTENVLLIAIIATATASAAETGSVKGIVVDSSQKGRRGAIISAINEDQQKSISVLTDSQGRFILDQLPPDVYVLRARLVGFEDNYTDEMEVSAGDSNKNHRFVMEPAKDLLQQRTGASLFGELKIDRKSVV
jgi:hypothetical protein